MIKHNTTRKYRDFIAIRGGKPAYSIEDEKKDEWESFLPNEQFNGVLRQVLKSVMANDIDSHKSFWLNGTYGTGKSHAAAVIAHLLGDPIDEIRNWFDKEYADPKYESIRNDLYKIRKTKRLLVVKMKGIGSIAHVSDLGPFIQQSVEKTLWAHDLDINVKTDYESMIEQIKQDPKTWDIWISDTPALSSIVEDHNQLIDNLEDGDLKTFRTVNDFLRAKGFAIRTDNEAIRNWLLEIQEKLREEKTYTGLIILWDEYTDVMLDAAGLPILKELQSVAEKFANIDNDSYIFLISHPSAFDNINPDQMKATDGRYHRMKYNMEPVSAFKIMSRKLEITNKELHRAHFNRYASDLVDLIIKYAKNSNQEKETVGDLINLYPLHPGTANLATHYATVVGSSSRSVFEFIGQNEAISPHCVNLREKKFLSTGYRNSHCRFSACCF